MPYNFNNNYNESYEQGKNWADRVFESGDELNHEEVSELADEYGKDPEAFYEGYRDTWNEYAAIWNRQVVYERGEGYKKPSLWVRLCGRG